MFSYTDDAIVTSSPTGRHLSTVIRRPAAIGPLDWSEHADQVCKVLNELDSKTKAGQLRHTLKAHDLGVQFGSGPLPHSPTEAEVEALIESVKAPGWWAAALAERYQPHEWRDYVAELIEIPGTRFMARSPSAERIAGLEKHVSSLETECLNTRERLKETEKQLDDETTKLAAAQMLLEQADRKIAVFERRITDYQNAATNRGN